MTQISSSLPAPVSAVCNVQAFALLIDRHKVKAMTLAIRIMKNREDAEEALQDAFVRAYRALPLFEWKSSFSTWFYRIVYNTCTTASGKKNKIHSLSIDVEDEDGLKTLWKYSESPSLKRPSILAQIVNEEVEKLPVVYGSTFTLFVVQEMSYEEIVQVTGLPLGTVKARLFRARAMLRESIIRRMDHSLVVNE